MPRQAMLVRALVELADTLVADFDVVDLLTAADRPVRRACSTSTAAGLMLAAATASSSVMASSSEAMRLLELFELQTEEGPCLDCFRTGQPIVNHDLDAARALAALRRRGVRGRVPHRCTPCRCGCAAHVIGALNLFHTEPGDLSRPTSSAAQALADVATIALLQHRAAARGPGPQRAAQPAP